MERKGETFIYADNAATTKVSETALSAMLPFYREAWGNPSSVHPAGQMASRGLIHGRETIAGLLGCSPRSLYFTSGGSEADNQALLTAAEIGKKSGRMHIISTAFEHVAVLKTLQNLQSQGFRLTLLKPSAEGYISAEQVEEAICDDTVLVSVMFANNEVGTLQPVSEIGQICGQRGILFHSDGVQAAGHVPVNVEACHVDMLSLSAHKFQGPKGIGLLYVRQGILPARLIYGGHQERGFRAGTENVAAAVGMAAALEERCRQMDWEGQRTAAMRDRLEAGLLSIPGAERNGGRERLAGISNVAFQGVSGEALLMMLAEKGICASAGAACASGSLEPSHVLLAMGQTPGQAAGAIRFSLSEANTEEEVDYMVETVERAVKILRGEIAG